MLKWTYYPRSQHPTDLARDVVAVFDAVHADITSNTHKLKSNEVLALAAGGLGALGFQVESGRKRSEKIYVPVLFGLNGKVEKSFEADAYHPEAANAMHHRVTKARSESLNSRIQWIKHTTRGFRNRARFRTAIYFDLGGLDMTRETIKPIPLHTR